MGDWLHIGIIDALFDCHQGRDWPYQHAGVWHMLAVTFL